MGVVVGVVVVVVVVVLLSVVGIDDRVVEGVMFAGSGFPGNTERSGGGGWVATVIHVGAADETPEAIAVAVVETLALLTPAVLQPVVAVVDVVDAVVAAATATVVLVVALNDTAAGCLVARLCTAAADALSAVSILKADLSTELQALPPEITVLRTTSASGAD